MNEHVQRTVAIALKEVMHIMRDPQVIIFALGMPLGLVLLFGYAISFNVDHVKLAVIDQDQTAASRAITRQFTASDAFDAQMHAADAKVIETAFRRGVAPVALVIPDGYERALGRGEQADIQLVLDGSDNNSANVAMGFARAIVLGATAREVAAATGSSRPPISVATRTLFNPHMDSAVFIVPGLIVVILAMIAVMLTALTIAREYERGSMEQLFATPVARSDIILGKLAPYFALGLLQVLLVLTVGVILFDVPINGSLLLVFAVASVFLLGMLAQGLVISIVTKRQTVASQVATITTVLPALLLSGFIFPIQNMPVVLRVVAQIFPAKHFVDALRAILLRGNGIEVIAVDVAAMAGFFVVMFVVALVRFERRVA